MKKYDTVIIGFGKGGKTLAGALAEAGKTVAVIERSAGMYGGTCINVGCIPTKSFVNSAQEAKNLSGGFDEKAERYKKAVEEKERLTATFRKKNFDKLDSLANVDVITGAASFDNPRRLSVQTESETLKLEGEQIFINTGSRPFVPPIPGIQDNPYVYISESLLNLNELPRQLVIIGGGYIGMEFASIYASFGSQVTVIQDGAVFLPREDEEIAGAVLKSLSERGVRVLFSAKAQQVTRENGHAAVHVETPQGREVIEARAVLVATGRRPDVDGLHLENAGVEITPRGAVKTDEYLRTNVPHIWAMGDVTGGLQFTYISLDDFRIVKSQLLGGGQRTTKNRGAVPYSVFLDPPFSRVGLTEKEARDKGYDVLVARLAAAAVPKARVLLQPKGLLKAVIDKKTGLILGAHLFCAESHEMINLLKLAIDSSIPYTVLRDNIYTHPTMSEALNDLFSSIAEDAH